MSMISNYPTVYKNSKKTVNTRRLNREWLRKSLAEAQFINRPRLVRVSSKITRNS